MHFNKYIITDLLSRTKTKDRVVDNRTQLGLFGKTYQGISIMHVCMRSQSLTRYTQSWCAPTRYKNNDYTSHTSHVRILSYMYV